MQSIEVLALKSVTDFVGGVCEVRTLSSWQDKPSKTSYGQKYIMSFTITWGHFYQQRLTEITFGTYFFVVR